MSKPDDEIQWSCFSCDYLGSDVNECAAGHEHCPQCGTQAGDGFGMAENDPRYRRATETRS